MRTCFGAEIIDEEMDKLVLILIIDRDLLAIGF